MNEAFIISGEKRQELINADPKSAEIIRPILRGRDIKRYGYTFADLWLINTHNGIKEKNIKRIDVNDYPAIKEHLERFHSELFQRTDQGDTPYNLRNCVYMDDFNKRKIIYPETTQGAYFFLDDGNYYIDKTCFFMICNEPEYLLATLSSTLFEFAYKNIFSSIELGTSGYQYNKHALVKLPIVVPTKISKFDLSTIKNNVDYIFGQTDNHLKQDCIAEINHIIYKLYDISIEEQRYRMVLDALDDLPTVADAHDFAVLGAAGDLEFRRDGRCVQRERVVAHRVERFGHAGEKSLAVVGDSGDLAVHDLLGLNDLCAERLADALMSEADPQHGDLALGGGEDEFRHDPGAFGPTGTGGEDDRFRAHRHDFGDGDFPVAFHGDLRGGREEHVNEIVGEGVVIVEDEDHFQFSSILRSAAASFTALKIAAALFMVSSYSFSGTESNTIPAPACTESSPSRISSVRMVMARSRLPV